MKQGQKRNNAIQNCMLFEGIEPEKSEQLLKEKAQRSRELVDQYEPVFKNSAEYVEFMEQFDSKEIFE